MADATRPAADEGVEVRDRDEFRDEFRTALSAIAGGVVGTTLMTGVLLLLNAMYGPDLNVFQTLAELAGAGENVVLGFVFFFGAGAVAWPLLFVALGGYLPGKTRQRQGLVFVNPLWVGFVVAFSPRRIGTSFLVFFVFSLASHAVYGYLLGFVSGRLTGDYHRSEPLV